MLEIEKRYAIIDKQKEKEMASITAGEGFDYILMAGWLVMLSKMQTGGQNATIELQKILTKQKELKELINNLGREKIKEDFNKFFELKISDLIPNTVGEIFS